MIILIKNGKIIDPSQNLCEEGWLLIQNGKIADSGRGKPSEKIQVVSIAELLGEAIIRTHDNRSISSLFEIER